MKRTPRTARMYLLFAAFLIALPTLSGLYRGAEGKLLVAAPSLRGDVFERSVVLIITHDLFYAFGIIINKPLPQGQGAKPVLYGGPVEADVYSALIGRSQPDGSFMLLSPAKEAAEAAKGWGDVREVRGYAGWGLLQLNNELRRGTWVTIDYDPALVFETPAGEIWAEAISRAKDARYGPRSPFL